MYRRNAARQPRINWRAALAALDIKSMAQRLVYAALEGTGLYEEAWRERGRRAVERRRRQIADGQIAASNGLVDHL